MGSAKLKFVPHLTDSCSLPKNQLPSGEHFINYLHDQGWIDAGDLMKATLMVNRSNATIDDIVSTNHMLTEADLRSAFSQYWNARSVSLDIEPPDPALMSHKIKQLCLKYTAAPWRQFTGQTFFATADPDQFQSLKNELPADFGDVFMVIASRSEIGSYLEDMSKEELSVGANTICPDRYSARLNLRSGPGATGLLLLGFGVLCAVTVPHVFLWVMLIWVFAYLFSTSCLRLAALYMHFTSPPPNALFNHSQPLLHANYKLPKVSVLVPLHQEADILPSLIANLKRSNYPKEILEVLLVLEGSDLATQAALGDIELPFWIKSVTVPPSSLQTKPRAMNFALNYCSGEIVGIYDAEDAPESDQISRIVHHFQMAGPKTACVQGYLDYYNPSQNWLSRCFTIEYAIWFRVVLPGIRKLGLPVPLGGTTVFFRRDILEKLGAWDAHNVTEDADLGMRLARLGYDCDFLSTTTYEEANCFVTPWIKQRSRWLKGYAMTWLTHMRSPRALLNDLGIFGFLTFQIIFLGTLSNFILAPSFWLLWWVALGGALPFVSIVPAGVWWSLSIFFIASESILFVLGITAVSRQENRALIPWVATMVFYWPLGTIAVYKALYELLISPFYWDKTKHGHTLEKGNNPKPNCVKNY